MFGIFRKKEIEGIVDPSERVNELILNILPDVSLGRTDEEKDMIFKGGQVQADDDVRKIFRECVELLNTESLDPSTRTHLRENIYEMRRNFIQIEEADLIDRAEELILMLSSKIDADRKQVEDSGEKIGADLSSKSVFEESVNLINDGKLDSDTQAALQKYVVEMKAIYSNLG